MGFTSVEIHLKNLSKDKEISLAIGRAIGFPDYFIGGWDGFLDALDEAIAVSQRGVIVKIMDAEQHMRARPHAFVRTVCQLMEATKKVSYRGHRKAQLEFLFLGDWTDAS